jgi:hypothetical protein
MTDLLAAATQEPVANGSRTKQKRPRVVDSPENDDEPGPSRRRGNNATADFPAFEAENEEENNGDVSEEDSATDEIDLKNYTMKDFKGAPVAHSSSVDRIVSVLTYISALAIPLKPHLRTDQSATVSHRPSHQIAREVRPNPDRSRHSRRRGPERHESGGER